jgi:hypothetical protein
MSNRPIVITADEDLPVVEIYPDQDFVVAVRHHDLLDEVLVVLGSRDFITEYAENEDLEILWQSW